MISIYALINPITNYVFYIGASKNPIIRLRTHIYLRKNTTFKDKQIEEILNANKDIEILILENCEKHEVKHLEEFYITMFKYYGFPLNQMSTSAYPKYHRQKINATNKSIVEYISHGYKVREIAEVLGINKRMIEKRIQTLVRSYGFKSIMQVMVYYLRKKIIE